MTTTRDHGFSLMEVLVALVVLSIALNAFYLTFSSIVNSVLYQEDKTAATWVALNVIGKAQLGRIDLQTINSQSAPSEWQFGKAWRWTATLNNTNDPAVTRITVAVKKSENSPTIARMTGFLQKDSP